MITKVMLIIGIGVICGVFGNETKCDEKKCLKVPKHYEEIGCSPVTEEGKCCPSRFDCSNLKNITKHTCVYNNKVYYPGNELEESITHPLCGASCRCVSYYGVGKFECSNIECRDLFFPPEPNCIQQYGWDHCCSSRTICDEAEIEKLSKCELHGRTYREGQKMYPKNRCYTCICSKTFENIPVEENPNCKRVDCGIQLRYMGRIREGCVPIYYGDNGCCPIGWRCPGEKDEIINQVRSVTETTDKCEFGKLKLNVGDVVKSNDKCDICKCTHPPMMHCIKDAECYESRYASKR